MPNGTKPCQLSPSWAPLGTPGLAVSPSAPSFWCCFPKAAPFAIFPAGWSGFGGDARAAGGSRLHTSSQPRGFSGTGQAVSVAPSFGNNSATAGSVPPFCLLGKLEGPVPPPGFDFSPSPFPALGFPGSEGQRWGGAKPDWCSLPGAPAVPLPSAGAFGLPGGDPHPSRSPISTLAHHPIPTNPCGCHQAPLHLVTLRVAWSPQTGTPGVPGSTPTADSCAIRARGQKVPGGTWWQTETSLLPPRERCSCT